MKIAVDASQLHSGYTGVGRYLYNLLEHMIRLDRGIEFTLFCSDDVDLKFDHSDIKIIILKTKRGNLYWQNFILNKAVKKGDFDLLWSPNYYSPVLYRKRSVISMHDVSWRALPDNYSFHNRVIREILSRISLKKASAVFTLSKFSRSEIMEYYGVDPFLIKVIHLAVDESFRRSDKNSIKNFKEKYGISDGPVIGFLGSIFKRRNIDKLIRSYTHLKKSYPELKLMLVGENYDPDVETLLRSEPSVILKKRLAENEVKDFYSSLDLFIYISAYEGFGLPPLEALKCGTTPLLLKRTSLKEIFSDIALFVDKADPQELSEKIDEYLKDNKTINKNILLKFRKRENYFNWERVAEEYIENFRELIYSGAESTEE
ncbi:MAG: glycosyltransferase family 1 protein [Acidobacteriota bacterium]